MNITELTNTVTASVRIVDRLAGGVEALALAVVTRATGWVASIPTLLLTSRTCETIFDLTPGAALASALALEVVGQSVVNTWLRAKGWNRNRRQTDRPASEWLMLAATVGYFVTDFVLVGILVMPKALAEPVYWAALLFPLAQVISTVVTGERAAQFRREADAEADSVKRSAAAREAAVVRARRKAEQAAEAARIAEAEAQLAEEAQVQPVIISPLPTLAFSPRQLAQIERVVAVHAENEAATLRDLQMDGLIGSDTTASRARSRAIAGGYLVETVIGFSPNGRERSLGG